MSNDLHWNRAWGVRDQGRRELRRLAQELLNRANLDVPVDTGYLRSTGRVEEGETGSLVSVVYDAEYAAAVHQRLWVHHPKGHAKWLELAAIEMQAIIDQRMAQVIRKETQG